MPEDYEREYREKLAQVNVQMSILAQDMREAGLDKFAARLEALREDVPYNPDRGTRVGPNGEVTRLESCEVKKKFICPKCGSDMFGTSGMQSEDRSQWLGHCHGESVMCDFTWPRSDDHLYFKEVK